MAILNSNFYTWIDHFFACMGGCFGCYTKPTPIIAVDEPTKGLRIQGKLVKKPSISDDWWSSSTFDLEYSAVQSQRSISSISTFNHNVNSNSGAGSVNSQNDFVNQGLNVWNENRLQWVGSGISRNPSQTRKCKLSWNVTYESLLMSKRPFTQPIPLSEVIELLVDVWDHEGLYD